MTGEFEQHSSSSAELAAFDPLDLVCNVYMLAEKRPLSEQLARSVADLFSGLVFLFLNAILFIPSVVLLTILGIAAVCYVLNNSEPIELRRVITLGLLLALAAGHGIRSKIGALRAYPFPTNIKLDADGLRFAWRGGDDRESECIPWNSIRRLSVTLSAQSASMQAAYTGVALCFDIEKTYFTRWTMLIVAAQTWSLWDKKITKPKGVIGISFPLDALTLDADKFRLLAAIKACTPEGAQSREFTELLESHRAPTYTQLWLDDMQSFRRQSVLELATGAELQQGRYRIHEKMATGGQAKIYLAQDTRTDTLVAMKELILPVNAGADVRNRSFANVKKEALLLSSLHHPGVLRLLDNFVEDHRAYLVLEYIEGTTLRQAVQSDSPFDALRAASTTISICDILAHLHGQSPPVVHCDLAPDNLMITKNGKVVLLDFNVAQQLESTTTKTVVGKHNYMAPEQFKGKPCTQSDLYSLGCTLYFLLTGKDPLPLTCSRPSGIVKVPAGLDDIVARLTALELSQRYQSVSEVETELRQLSSGS